MNEGVINILGTFFLFSPLVLLSGQQGIIYQPITLQLFSRSPTECYFVMTRADAQRCLEVYKNFFSQTQRVIGFLEHAKDFQQHMGIELPTLRIVSSPFPFITCVSMFLRPLKKLVPSPLRR